MNKNNLVRGGVISTFVLLYLLVSVISTIHVIDFFEMSNPYWLAVTLAIAFELGAAASLASLVVLKKMNKGLVWALFITITLMQMQGNMYYAFKNIQDYQSWSELFNLVEEEAIYQKRVLAFVSGAILPLVALGFIKSLVDYIKPEDDVKEEDLEAPSESIFDEVKYDVNDEVKYDVNDGVKNEAYDEDHELDIVLNTMAADLEEEEETSTWEATLTDGLDVLEEEEDAEVYPDLNEQVESMRKVVEAHDALTTEIDEFKEQKEVTGFEDILSDLDGEEESGDDLFKKAMFAKAQEEMDLYLKGKENGEETTN